MVSVEFAQWVIDDLFESRDVEALGQVILLEMGSSVADEEIYIHFDDDDELSVTYDHEFLSEFESCISCGASIKVTDGSVCVSCRRYI